MFLSRMALAMIIDLKEVLSRIHTLQSVSAVMVADLGELYRRASSPKADPS